MIVFTIKCKPQLDDPKFIYDNKIYKQCWTITTDYLRLKTFTHQEPIF